MTTVLGLCIFPQALRMTRDGLMNSFLAIAMAEAEAAGRRGEVPVGAVVVKGGEVTAGAATGVVELAYPPALP
jgi:tRNA(Arg) A34 adenosine deaminase TadA